MAWNAGYMTDTTYTYGYYPELNPVRTAFSLRAAGTRSPIVRNACELGFGQGLSTIIHAASQPDVQWWGTDFNPTQAAFAQDLAGKADCNARLFDQSFEEFCTRDDLPEFEFIALHGIWSWISDDNRSIIVDFLRRKLAVGGVLYISYNCLPGWSAAAPIRHLLKQFDSTSAARGLSIEARVQQGLAFLQELLAANPAYVRAYPTIAERIEAIGQQDVHYLAHEYLNDSWEPMHFSQVAQRLDDAKLSFVCSANVMEQQDSANLTSEQMKLLAAHSNVQMRETARDFIMARQFRRDLWVRGPQSYPSLMHVEEMRKQRYLLVQQREKIAMTVPGQQGEVTLHPQVYDPVLSALADHQIKTLEQVERAVAGQGVTLPQAAAALGMLVGTGSVAPVQEDKVIAKARSQTDKLNREIFRRARYNNDISYLASPVTGGAFTLGRFEQLFLAARAEGLKEPAQWAKYVADLLAMQGQKLVREGQPLEGAAETLEQLTELARDLAEKHMPLLKVLGIA